MRNVTSEQLDRLEHDSIFFLAVNESTANRIYTNNVIVNINIIIGKMTHAET